MTRRSLRFRLLVAAIVSVAAALVIAGVSLAVIFEHHVERRVNTELDTYLNQIIAGVSMTNDGRIGFDQALSDPRFKRPLSGLYWQIQDRDRPTLLRSRSLWDDSIELPEDEPGPGTIHEHILPGPAGRAVMVRERQIIFRPDSERHRIRVAVALDRQDLIDARNAFAADMLPYLGVMAAVLVIAVWIQIRIGLAPLDTIRRGVMAIRSGATHRLDPVYPDEVMPLVDELNGLLEAQEQAMEGARAWTADLAHGLKTPLMALTADSQRLREAGNTAIADDLEQLSETMRMRVDRELIRARVRSGVQTRSLHADTADAVERIVRTLKRTPRGAILDWSVTAAEGIDAAILADDLTELLGNIMENATKWAKSRISVSVARGDPITIEVEDDGPGVPEEQLDRLGRRGLRLDEQKQGSGLGLAIARDIVDAYHGDLSFSHRPIGGLNVTVRLPAAS